MAGKGEILAGRSAAAAAHHTCTTRDAPPIAIAHPPSTQHAKKSNKHEPPEPCHEYPYLLILMKTCTLPPPTQRINHDRGLADFARSRRWVLPSVGGFAGRTIVMSSDIDDDDDDDVLSGGVGGG